MNMGDTHIYTVTELTRDIRAILENTFRAVWVMGEISNFSVSSAGHTYFSVKDENSLINSVMFKGGAQKLRFTPKDGTQVICSGRVSVYDKRGQYQLYVETMEPQGIGALQKAFEELKKKLNEEGLFEESRKRKIPVLPLHIGMITSLTGAALKDMLNVASRRFGGIRITIRPVLVQGDKAKEDIVSAISELNGYNDVLEKSGEAPIDVLILARGGGSLEDLWAFNEECVARAICASDIPVVSGVGHEVDYTIADFVADMRAPTPSAAAELVVPMKQELMDLLEGAEERITSAIKRNVMFYQRSLDALKDSYILRSPVNVLSQSSQLVDDLLKRTHAGLRYRVEVGNKELGTLSGRLNALSPLAVMGRGFSIVYKGGQIQRSVKGIRVGDDIETLLADGYVNSKVTGIERRSKT
ncbi:MAG: exodeoxyribonuclease VII large subunit [Candidatus Omnitrophica bacterium]|nr:exodeoxyribonuclease VII large subunit [Candidatus Omnitrophota bacterium]